METGVFYQNRFQEEYFKADSKGKIDRIRSNYVSFLRRLRSIEDGIRIDIKVDQDYKRRTEKGDIGIRVQTSGVSDPTCRDAIRNVELERAFKENDLESELEKTCDPNRFRKQLQMLDLMKEDYNLVKTIIGSLALRDEEILNDYFDYQKKRMNFVKIAEDEEILVGSFYQRVWRAKKKVKESAIERFNRKYGR